MAAPGVAVPGSVVAIGSQVSPAGPQGIQGSAGPSAVSANANNKATLGSDSLILVQGTAAGIAATTHAQTVSGDDPQLTNARTPTAHHTTHEHGGSDLVSVTYSDLLSIPTTFAPAAHEASHVTGSDQIPLASASTKGLLNQTSGNTTDFIDGTNNSQALQPVIWSVRLRSFNAIGNPTFEIDQRNAGTGLVNPVAGTFLCDRYFYSKVGSMTINTQQLNPGAGYIFVPGTNFAITSKYLNMSLTAQDATLAAGDALYILCTVEGPLLRELIGDVHSASLLVSSSVANLKFSLVIVDVPATKSLCKLCSLGAASTWTLITLPNLPSFASAGGGFASSLAPGTSGYQIRIGLAAGTTFMPPSNDTFISGNFIGAVGMDNFASKPINSSFSLAFLQNEPGNQCTTPIDCPFTTNLDACQRYYQKTYSYPTAVGTVTTVGSRTMSCIGAGVATGPVSFLKTMAKPPTVTAYNTGTGAANSIRDSGAVDRAVTSIPNVSDNGLTTMGVTGLAANSYAFVQYTADTGF